ncbi:hypothetical protein I8751_18275 [Nostocaceae cyanobacterium CENA357]|uniref:Transposase n=1 Tax=Atlanticothrix silvestris CENA357 TaxID=1725252 RepID=A0A8J7L3Z7_9CYAN|nr:hypothetical protein [Atlanticothrix silvestris CENA357]
MISEQNSVHFLEKFSGRSISPEDFRLYFFLPIPYSLFPVPCSLTTQMISGIKADSYIRNAHIKSTVERIKEHEIVLMIQDTTNIDLTSHPGTSGIGYLDNTKCFGLKVHSTFAASTLREFL